MISYIIIGILVFLSAICKAVCDKVAYHYEDSIFNGLNDTWFDASKSWKNKNTWSKNKFITYLLRNQLVFITDAWHFFGMLERILLFACIAFPITWYFIPLYYIGFATTFHVFFTYLFESKTYRSTLK